MKVEEILEQRLSEMANDVPSTVFEAGYNSVLKVAAQNYLNEGWDVTLSKMDPMLEKIASYEMDEFSQGQHQAVNDLLALNEEDFVSAFTQTTTETEEENNMNDELLPFDFAKIASLEELAERADAGQSFGDLINAVMETLGEDGLDKHASEEDRDIRLGVESACYQFLKVANEVFGQYDLSDATDDDVIEVVFEKIAEEEQKSRARRALEFAKRNKGKLAAGAALAAAGAVEAKTGAGRRAARSAMHKLKSMNTERKLKSSLGGESPYNL